MTKIACSLLGAFLLTIAAQASAEVMDYSRCQLEEGKTIEDVQKWVTDWRALAKKNNINYQLRLLVPHADTTLSPGEFFIEGRTPSLGAHAAAWQWWYTNADAAKSGDQLAAAATCRSAAVYRGMD